MAVDYNHRAILARIGACAAVVAGALWIVSISFTVASKSARPPMGVEAQSGGSATPSRPAPPPATIEVQSSASTAPSNPSVSVEAESGSIAIGGNVSGSTINVGGAPNLVGSKESYALCLRGWLSWL